MMQGMLSNRSMPPSTVIPVIPYADLSQAIGWLTAAFGFRLRVRIGDHRAQMVVPPDGHVVLGAVDDGTPISIARVMVRVIDARSHAAHAVAAGAKMISPPQDYPYGERQYTVDDFAGHRWTFSESIGDVDPAEWGGIVLADDQQHYQV